ncbi:HET-domain-containing protein, partial [Byssothecium circinans]
MKQKTFRLHADAAGHLFCLKEDAHDDSLFKPRIPGQNAALSQVKNWLDFCASHHSLCQNRESQVTGLKLLDCETYDVVPAPTNANYVALSYVWGTTVSDSEAPAMEYDGAHTLDPRITKTIRDAATAAKGLGYKYLWVDKLCIDQGNAEEKHHQISKMDSIYGSADMTIIAACGQECYYGLPGVNGTPRTPRRNVKAGQINVFSSTRHPHDHIRSSKWVSRGWTLQEACLSTRRLVFTDTQLYFECNTMHCSETI